MTNQVESFFNNISWSKKIYLLMGLFGIGIAIVGFVGGVGIQYLSISFQSGIETAQKGLDASVSARASTLAMDKAMYRLISSSEPDEIRTSAISAIKAASFLDESLQKLTAALPNNPKVVELVKLNEEIKPLRMDVIRFAKKDEDKDAILKLKEISIPLSQIDELSTSILDEEQNYLLVLASENQTRANNMIYVLVAIIVGGAIFLGILAIILKNLLIRPLLRMEHAIEKMSEGNLSEHIEASGKDEVGMTLAALRSTLDSLNEIVAAIRLSSNDVTAHAQYIAESAKNSSAMEATLQQSVASVRSASDSLLANTGQTSEHLKQAVSSTEDTVTAVADNVAGMQQLVDYFDGYQAKMSNSLDVAHELVTSVNDIASITQTIQGIADQTNLLALNAAIEAARAGEQGRGFAVVADEVRKLADMTATATKKIHQIALRIRNDAGLTVKALEDSVNGAGQNGQRLKEIAEAVNQASSTAVKMQGIMKSIEGLMGEQRGAVDHIKGNVSSLELVAGQSGEQSSTLHLNATELRNTAAELGHMMSKFKLRN